MSLTIRTRITAWYTALLIVTLLVLGSLAYAGVWWLVRANADEVLRTKFESVSAEVEFDGNVLRLDMEQSETGNARIEEGLDFLRVIDATGQPLHELRRRPGLPLGDDPLQQALSGRETWDRIWLDGASFRIYTAPVINDGQAIAAVQVGRSEAGTDTVLGYVRLAGALAMVVGLVLAWFGGHFIARLVLEPVERIRRSAEAINAQGLSRRLGPPYSQDELGSLTRSFDAMIDRLDRAFRREQQFTADASHELRTPLSILRTEIEVSLRQERTSEEYRDLLVQQLDEVTRLSKLVEDMLTLARIDAGYHLRLTDTALHDIVLTAADRLSSLMVQRGLTMQIDRLTPVTIQGDPGWLTQVVLALMQNAVQHTPRGGTVTVSLSAEGANAVLSVADTGTGIELEHLPRIFDRFYRASSARTRLDGGAGLGLAICAWTVREHRGTIRVESEPGHGATFTVVFPLERKVAPPNEQVALPSRLAASA